MWFKAKHISPTQEHWIIEIDYQYMSNQELKDYLTDNNLKGVDDIVGNTLVYRMPLTPERFDKVYKDIKTIIKV